MTFDQASKADLINARHPNELDAKATSFPPTDLCQFNAKRGAVVRHQDFHLEIGARLYNLIAYNAATRHRHVVHRAFSYEGIAGKNDGESSEHSLAIADFHTGRPSLAHLFENRVFVSSEYRRQNALRWNNIGKVPPPPALRKMGDAAPCKSPF